MVTVAMEDFQRFTVDIRKDEMGTIHATITNENGQERRYNIPQRKLLVLQSINGPVRSAVEFLLGTAK